MLAQMPHSRSSSLPQRHTWFAFLALVLLAASLLVYLRLSPPSVFIPSVTSPNLSKLPLAFELNAGQTSDEVRYLARANGGTFFFTPSEVVLSLKGADDSSGVLRTSFVGANSQVEVSAGELMSGKVNYLLGNDPAGWRSDVATYSTVNYGQLYSGIDLAYSGSEGHLKSTYTVAPGVDPASIKWRYTGASGVSIDSAGNLQIAFVSSDGTALAATETTPVAWQTVNGSNMPVAAQFRVHADGVVGFVVGKYDRSLPLVIDPALVYSTYFGGSSADAAYDVKVDASGNIYFTGYTSSASFPITNAIQPVYGGGTRDVFVTKMNPTGSALIYSTFLGGAGEEVGMNMALNAQGEVYVTGYTESPTFPTANAVQPNISGGFDAFLTKLNASGSALVFSTFYGGNNQDQANKLALDGSGNAYFTGNTNSSNFPIQNAYQPILLGNQDAFLVKITSNGSSVPYATYFGGSAADVGYGVAASSDGQAYITGYTLSSNLPITNAFQTNFGGGAGDGFATKFNMSGSALVYSTYLGGSSNDVAEGCEVDGDGYLYVTGYTNSNNFPVHNALQLSRSGSNDVFVTKFNPGGSTVMYSTYLGGSGSDIGSNPAFDEDGNVYVVGYTSSGNYPVQDPVQGSNGGGIDAFVSALNANGSALIYSTYLGGAATELGVEIAVGIPGHAYVAGNTTSANFPLASPYQATRSGNEDGFISHISEGPETATPTGTSTRTPTRTPTSTPTRTPTSTPTSTHTPTCGLRWRPFSTDNPGSASNYLSSVDVISPNDVWAVGYYENDEDKRTLALHWDGNAWATLSTPNSGILDNELVIVSAISSNDVWAVGHYYIGTTVQTLTMHWDGTLWTIINSPNLGSGYNYLRGVYAISASNVWAVGFACFSNCQPAADTQSLVMHWDGRAWSLVSVPNVPARNNYLWAVTASGPDDVWAVGEHNSCYGCVTQTLTLHWDGTEWEIIPSPNVGSSTNTVRGLATLSSTDVWAAGYYYTGSIWRTLIMHWNGSSWAIIPSPNVVGANNFLQSLSAASPSDIWAVGSWGGNSGLTLHWDGAEWNLIESPQSSGITYLTAVSASAADYVWAVGINTTTLQQTFSQLYSEGCPTSTPTNIPTNTPTNNPSATNTATQAPTHTAISTTTRTNTPTNTSTSTNTPTDTPTNTPTDTLSNTPTETATETSTATPTICTIEFEDVPPGSTFYSYIRCLACQGIINGYPCGEPGEPCVPPGNKPYYRPSTNISRAQLSKVVSEAAGFDDPVAGQYFQDVPEGSTFWLWIQRLVIHEVLSGYPCGGPGEPCVAPGNLPYFRPNGVATRGQLTKIVSNSAGFDDDPLGQMFEDVAPGATFYTYTQRLTTRLIMEGYPCGNPEPCVPPINRPYFRPNSNVTRSQTAKIVANTFFPDCSVR